MMRRKFLVLACLASILTLFTSCAAQQAQTAVGRIAGLDRPFVVDYHSKFFGDNTIFCQEIAMASLMVMSRPGQGPQIMAEMGLENVRVREIGARDNDQNWIVMGHRLIEYDGEKRVVILVSIPGVYGIHGLFSNSDVGADTPEYFELTGSQHPEWVNRYNHKGFDVTANRIISEIRSYMRTIHSDAQPVLWITGFSRGGAIAGIVGAYFEKDAEIISFTYTFATPKNTTSASARQYKTIFNIINEDDTGLLMLPAQWGFTRLGSDISISIIGYGQEAFRRLTREDYIFNINHHDNVNSIIYELVALIPSREALYVFDNNIFFASESFPTRDEAEAEMRRMDRVLRRETRQFAEFYIYEFHGGEGYRVVHYQSPAFSLKVLSTMLYAQRAGTYEHIPYLAYQLDEILTTLLTAFEFFHPHSPEAYYLIITDLLPYALEF